MTNALGRSAATRCPVVAAERFALPDDVARRHRRGRQRQRLREQGAHADRALREITVPASVASMLVAMIVVMPKTVPLVVEGAGNATTSNGKTRVMR